MNYLRPDHDSFNSGFLKDVQGSIIFALIPDLWECMTLNFSKEFLKRKNEARYKGKYRFPEFRIVSKDKQEKPNNKPTGQFQSMLNWQILWACFLVEPYQ